jgi:hypothetical protein
MLGGNKLLGLEDERTRRLQRVLERLIVAHHLEKGVAGWGNGRLWSLIRLVSELCASIRARARRADEKSPKSEQLVVSILPGSESHPQYKLPHLLHSRLRVCATYYTPNMWLGWGFTEQDVEKHAAEYFTRTDFLITSCMDSVN